MIFFSGVSAFNKSSPGASTTDTLQSMRELFAQKGRMPTLHEVMMAEKADFEAKVERATKRKAWLTANQTLLRTLLSYCSLRGGKEYNIQSAIIVHFLLSLIILQIIICLYV